MVTKTFKAESLAEALKKIRTELGSNAKIVSTKKIDPKNSILFKSKGYVEVVAQSDEHAKYKPNANSPKTEQSKEKKKENSDSKISTAPFFERLNNLSQEGQSKLSSTTDENSENEIRRLKSKIKQLEERVEELSDAPDTLNPQRSLSPLDNLLSRQGIGNGLLKVWQEQEKKLIKNVNAEGLIDNCAEFFLEHTAIDSRAMPKIIAFVGSAGSGKTSSILKLATRLKQEKKKVAVFTLDGNIASTEQMNYESDKIGVPFSVIYQIRTFRNAERDYKDYDHILIDTYSVSPKDEKKMLALNERLQKMKVACYAVMSARDVDNIRTLKSFEKFKPRGAVYTRLDEVYSIGHVINTIYESGVPASYFGIGPNSGADDLEEASAERLVAMLLNVDASESIEMSMPSEQVGVSERV